VICPTSQQERRECTIFRAGAWVACAADVSAAISSRAPSNLSYRHFVHGCFIVARLQDSLRTLVHDIDLIVLARFPERKRRQAGRYCGFACIVSKGNIDVSAHSGQRLAQLTTPLGKDVLVLASFVAAEGLSELFEIDVETLSRNEHLDFDKTQTRSSARPGCKHASAKASGGKDGL
jgi:hypothetical protein